MTFLIDGFGDVQSVAVPLNGDPIATDLFSPLVDTDLIGASRNAEVERTSGPLSSSFNAIGGIGSFSNDSQTAGTLELTYDFASTDILNGGSEEGSRIRLTDVDTDLAGTDFTVVVIDADGDMGTATANALGANIGFNISDIENSDPFTDIDFDQIVSIQLVVDSSAVPNADTSFDSFLVVVADLEIEKTGSFTDEDGDGFATAGETTTYMYQVTNPGDFALANVMVSDDNVESLTETLGGANPATNIGDGDGDGELDPGEIWEYTGVHVVTQAEIDAGETCNVVDVEGTAPNDAVVMSQDDLCIPLTPPDPGILIEKTGAFADEDGDTFATAGETATYEYEVTNTGNVALANVMVMDDNVETLTQVDDGAGFNIGDLNQDNVLDLAEIWEYTGVHVVTQAEIDAGETCNVVDVEGTAPNDAVVMSQDDLCIPLTPPDPGILIEKTGAFADEDGDTFATAGETATYEYEVTNTGNVALANVMVMDDNVETLTQVDDGAGFNIGDLNQDNVLDLAEIWEYTGVHVVTQAEIDAGETCNVVDVEGTAPNDAVVMSQDDLCIPLTPPDPGILIEKTGAFADEDGDTFATAGETATYEYEVTNTGNVALANVMVMDDNVETLTQVDDGAGFNIGDLNQDNVLDLAEIWEYTGVHVVTQAEIDAGETCNVVDVEGTAPNDAVVMSQDDLCIPLTPPPDEPGCANTPGFWKNKVNKETGDSIFEQETGYDPNGTPETTGTDDYEAFFGVDVEGWKKVSDDPTFQEALSANGGGESALLRSSTAAMANILSDDAVYSFGDGSGFSASSLATLEAIDTSGNNAIEIGELITAVQGAFASEDWNPLATALDDMNNVLPECEFFADTVM